MKTDFNALSKELKEAFNRRFHQQAKFTPDTKTVVAVVADLKDYLFQYPPLARRFGAARRLAQCAKKLEKQILNAMCFMCETRGDCTLCKAQARCITQRFFAQLPQIQRWIISDVQAAFEGDPAAISEVEPLLCYPGVLAVAYYRLAHALQTQGVQLIPRIITEYAHSLTGIDIHPGAQIGPAFFIDHGTGVVIGETCVIGAHVKLYQGVTLGAKSFPLDENGHPVKGIKRHPNIGNHVIIYAETTVLGNVNIGDGAVLGANKWITADVPAGAKV